MKRPSKARKFYEPKAGEWVFPNKRGYLMQCCDCGLVHRMDFKPAVELSRKGSTVKFMLLDGDLGVAFRVYRANRETARQRKKRGITVR